MQAKVVRDIHIHIRRVVMGVSDVPDLEITQPGSRPRIIRPDKAAIQVQNGAVIEVEVSGAVVMKSGDPSTQFMGHQSWHPDNWGTCTPISDAPDWVRQLWSEPPVLAGVNPPSQPTQ